LIRGAFVADAGGTFVGGIFVGKWPKPLESTGGVAAATDSCSWKSGLPLVVSIPGGGGLGGGDLPIATKLAGSGFGGGVLPLGIRTTRAAFGGSTAAPKPLTGGDLQGSPAFSIGALMGRPTPLPPVH